MREGAERKKKRTRENEETPGTTGNTLKAIGKTLNKQYLVNEKLVTIYNINVANVI